MNNILSSIFSQAWWSMLSWTLWLVSCPISWAFWPLLIGWCWRCFPPRLGTGAGAGGWLRDMRPRTLYPAISALAPADAKMIWFTLCEFLFSVGLSLARRSDTDFIHIFCIILGRIKHLSWDLGYFELC